MPATDDAPFQIRAATPDDVSTVYDLVLKLADYERLRSLVTATPDDLREALFGERPAAEALLAFDRGAPVGFALYFTNFSTFMGRPGLYLEDIFVEPEHRGKGIGKALLQRLGRIALERRCGRIEWSVLAWNQPSIEFYERLGAQRMEEWRTYRLTGEPMRRLADL